MIFKKPIKGCFDQGAEGDGIVIWQREGVLTDCWVNSGGVTWRILESEKKMPIEDYYYFVKNKWNMGEGVYRCSGCGFEMKRKDVASWPLFSGCACAPCTEKHKEKTKQEIVLGHVCRMCGRPYSNCSC